MADDSSTLSAIYNTLAKRWRQGQKDSLANARGEVYPIAANVLRGLGYEQPIRNALKHVPVLGNAIADQLFSPFNAFSIAMAGGKGGSGWDKAMGLTTEGNVINVPFKQEANRVFHPYDELPPSLDQMRTNWFKRMGIIDDTPPTTGAIGERRPTLKERKQIPNDNSGNPTFEELVKSLGNVPLDMDYMQTKAAYNQGMLTPQEAVDMLKPSRNTLPKIPK